MPGLVRLTYWLGWIFLAIAVIGRFLVYTSLRERMIDSNIVPHNALQLSFLFFVIAIATSVCHSGKP